MKSSIVSCHAPSPSGPSVGDLYRYVGPVHGSEGEIVVCTGPSAATVIHSVCPTYPIGHTYAEFYRRPSTWERVSSVTLRFTS